MATIPEVQEEMRSAAARLRMFGLDGEEVGLEALELAADLDRWAAELRRRRVAPNGRVTSNRVTPSLAQAVVQYHLDHPQASWQEIAKVFGVNPGRISEILTGKRR
jgi:hypothetical protein